MTQSEATPPATEAEPVLAIIGRIKNKQLHPHTLSAEDRRRCVEVLRAEGYTQAEIAQILQRSERTIQRDLDQSRADHAVTVGPQFAEAMIGDLIRQAETSAAHLRRIARESAASAMERAMAESFAWKVIRELFEKLQSVGYLPRVPQGIVAELFQHAEIDPVAGYEQLVDQIQELQRVDRALGRDDPDRHQRQLELLDEVQRGRLSVQVERLRRQALDIEGQGPAAGGPPPSDDDEHH
jgi:uncharacterized protein with von Willebrand factor type A (vWA) domain